MKRIFIAIIAVTLCMGLFFVGCSGGGGDRGELGTANSAVAAAPQATASGYAMEMAKAEEYAMEAEPDYAYDGAAIDQPLTGGGGVSDSMVGGIASPSVTPDAANRKIVYTADVNLQTKEFDAGVARVEEMTAQYEGFIQSSRVQGRNMYDYGYGKSTYEYGYGSTRYAYYTVRIPESGMRTFLSDLEEHFNVGSSSIYSDDITGTYFDTQARLDSLRVQQDKLLEMLDKSEDVEYLLQVQTELARVGYEIESLTSAMNRMKDSVAYSTINLTIEEVVEYEPTQTIHTTFGEKAGNAFSGAWKSFVYFCQDFALWVVSITPFLAFAVPIAILLIVLWRIRRKKRRILQAQQAAAYEQMQSQLPPQQAQQNPPEQDPPARDE